ncbi:hypothetical protein ACWT_5243 [Actinoplanes sp. SE50]|uniref:hypothetical protein n=1 Tax=unclassified Actinoplanes TaxID=2626549 RepID=UPI00023EBDA1|nr:MULTISPECIES: hypothetical protein [unclassified Actinoplanes]AEV86261.1 hypothetical protein ACPL_5374 [Actinoplanes sp. SE50/110]ATO84658.1 hypothetical protein ACWT_5243 [Actinoplanes sp. SE50]SLM02068.1 uncharacterized protein ACSP50_5306 [Actinoplanes sp. SE50/110]
MKRYRSNAAGSNARRWRVAGIAGVAVVLAGVGLGVANAATSEAVPTVNCPQVAPRLPAVPAAAKAEVERNLALLNTQIQEANKRLATSVGQGGPNFIQNAILGPLKDKRASTIDRIAISIGRRAAKPNLPVNQLATCALNKNGGGNAAPEPTTVAADNGAAAGNNGAAAGVPTVNCPTVGDKLPAVPASAKAEIERNLALLNTQIQEANKRLASTVGQGGKNFIQNAILGPLKDKRFATINRMETAIGRAAAKPDLNAEGLSGCTLNQNGGGNPAPEQTAVQAQDPAVAAANAPTVNCPDVKIGVAIPASAQAEIDRNLALLQTQIQEANKRLASTIGQGGPNFIQNAILGPLKDKRFSTINRMETAIGRQAAKPNLNAEGLSTCSLNK